VIADLELGARVVDDGVQFRVWAPRARTVEVELGDPARPRLVALARGRDGVFAGRDAAVAAGDDYALRLDGGPPRPDPVSRSQPYGVHGRSRVVDPTAFAWTDADWRGIPLDALVIYELHVGTFTEGGTFDAIIPELPRLDALGITAIELMPVAEFPGGRNWGYDGVHPFAPQSTYGGPDGLRRLVDACHAAGLAVVMDVVYNHLGPEGNYLGEIGPFFTDRYKTPWGKAIDFDGPESAGVRRHFITNALHWMVEYHIDALRLDAIHGIFDASPRHILADLVAEVRATELPRAVHVIAESDLNDVRVITPIERGGYGVSAQWSDDFHHALRTVLTGDRRGYYADFGKVGQLVKAIRHGFVYDGGMSTYRKRPHGTPSGDLPGRQFVICLQNHDQIANGAQGHRIREVLDLRSRTLAAVLMFTTPGLPLLFMGEEYDDPSSFVYFVSHGDPDLVAAVRAGRRAELGDLADELGEAADPQGQAAFDACKLDRAWAERPGHAEVLALYRDLIALRRRERSLANLSKDLTRVGFDEEARWMVIERGDPSGEVVLVVCNLGDAEVRVSMRGPVGDYRLALATDTARYGGPSAESAGPARLTLAAGEAVELAIPPRTAWIFVETIGKAGGAS